MLKIILKRNQDRWIASVLCEWSELESATNLKRQHVKKQYNNTIFLLSFTSLCSYFGGANASGTRKGAVTRNYVFSWRGDICTMMQRMIWCTACTRIYSVYIIVLYTCIEIIYQLLVFLLAIKYSPIVFLYEFRTILLSTQPWVISTRDNCRCKEMRLPKWRMPCPK